MAVLLVLLDRPVMVLRELITTPYELDVKSFKLEAIQYSGLSGSVTRMMIANRLSHVKPLRGGQTCGSRGA